MYSVCAFRSKNNNFTFEGRQFEDVQFFSVFTGLPKGNSDYNAAYHHHYVNVYMNE